jgi:hypothetical protein
VSQLPDIHGKYVPYSLTCKWKPNSNSYYKKKSTKNPSL